VKFIFQRIARQQGVPLALRFQGVGACGNPFSAAGKVVISLGVFLLSASDDHDVSLDGVIGVECRSAVTPRAVLQADIFIDGVFGLGHAQILRKLILSCEIS
jgi:hypothetical protein